MTMTMTREKYTRRMKGQLDDLNLTITSLERRTMEAAEEVRETHYTELAELRRQSRIAVSKLSEVKAASEESWEKMVGEMDKVRDAFVYAFNYFKNQL